MRRDDAEAEAEEEPKESQAGGERRGAIRQRERRRLRHIHRPRPCHSRLRRLGSRPSVPRHPAFVAPPQPRRSTIRCLTAMVVQTKHLFVPKNLPRSIVDAWLTSPAASTVQSGVYFGR